MNTLQIVLWIIGMPVGYVIYRKLNQDEWTAGLRIIGILMGIVFSWFMLLVLGIALLVSIGGDKPAKW